MLVRVVKGNLIDESFNLPENIHITRREMGALALVANGLNNEDAAKKLGVSTNTFRNHVFNVMKKLGANNRAHAVVLAIQNGIIEVAEKKELARTARIAYGLCCFCLRAFDYSEVVEVEGDPIVVNHVRWTGPTKYLCPYEGCNGWADQAVAWADVREDHPEYPEIPEHGVKYNFDYEKYLRDMGYLID